MTLRRRALPAVNAVAALCGVRRKDIAAKLATARDLARVGEDAAARQAYLDILAQDQTDFDALTELGALACVGGHRAAAMTVYRQAIHCHPGQPIGHVNLANLLLADGDMPQARAHYETALRLAPGFPPAHQGMARVLTELGEDAGSHWRDGFAGHAVVVRPYRGRGVGVPVVLLVSALGGNIPTDGWLDDRVFAVTAILVEFAPADVRLPPCACVVNAIGDADLCEAALDRAEALLAGITAPVINPPSRARATGRVANAARMAAIPGVIAPRILAYARAALLSATDLPTPLLVRSAGFHTGRHFVRVDAREALADAVAGLPGERLLAIDMLDARGPDGLARKYRVMCVDGALYPLHLALSTDWKVHYFTADMAANAGHRAEEGRFLDDMETVLGPRAIAALSGIASVLGLDYAGIDFALAADRSVLLFEANATMVISPPDADPIWEYRRGPIEAVQLAVRRMLWRRAGMSSAPP